MSIAAVAVVGSRIDIRMVAIASNLILGRTNIPYHLLMRFSVDSGALPKHYRIVADNQGMISISVNFRCRMEEIGNG